MTSGAVPEAAMAMTPVQAVTLRHDYQISRVICGDRPVIMGSGEADFDRTVDDMTALADAGITTFDCAGLDSKAESRIAAFRAHYLQHRGADKLARIKFQMHLVPALKDLAALGRSGVRRAINSRLSQLGLDHLDLVQLHWWDYDVPRYLDVLCWLDELKCEGKIAYLGVANFDTVKLIEIITSGISVMSIQADYSLIDRRPEQVLVRAAQDYNVGLFAANTDAGGFLADDWLDKAEPDSQPECRAVTRSKLIVDDFGGWALFQSLLRTLRDIADRHETDISIVASAAILDRKGVAAVISNTGRLGDMKRHVRIATLALTDADRSAIAVVLAQGFVPEGDSYTLERDQTGRHGRVAGPD